MVRRGGGAAPPAGAWLALLTAAAVALTGCTTLRPRDDQRTEIAKEAAAQAQALRQPDASPFGAMEQNVQTVEDAWDQVTQIQSQDRQDTFYADLGGMSREDLRQELALAIQAHLLSLRTAQAAAQAAAADVQEQLDRQETLARLAGQSSGGSLQEVLQNVEKRLDWIHDLQVNVARALAVESRVEAIAKGGDGAGGGGSAGTAAAAPPALRGAETLDDVRKFLQEVDTNPQVQASSELVLRAGQELAEAERARLSELRQHLLEVQQALDAVEGRQGDYFRFLAIPSLRVVLTQDEFWQALANVESSIGVSCPGGFDPNLPIDLPLLADPAAPAPPPAPSSLEIVDCLIEDLRGIEDEVNQSIAELQEIWAGAGTLAAFVEQSLQRTEPVNPFVGSAAVGASRLVPQVAILLFVEEPADAEAELAISRLQHLSSIRQSQINADERLALVEQVSQALQIYYQGGLSPAQVAQAVLLASQALATYYIGTQL